MYVFPEPAQFLLSVFKSAVSVHAEPFQLSVSPLILGLEDGPAIPPKTIADSVFAPEPPKYCLPKFKSATSVQLEPFHSSVSDLAGLPPTAKLEVDVPILLANPNLAVFKSLTSVQPVPSQTSVLVISLLGGPSPPNTIAADAVPAPPFKYLALPKLTSVLQEDDTALN